MLLSNRDGKAFSPDRRGDGGSPAACGAAERLSVRELHVHHSRQLPARDRNRISPNRSETKSDRCARAATEIPFADSSGFASNSKGAVCAASSIASAGHHFRRRTRALQLRAAESLYAFATRPDHVPSPATWQRAAGKRPYATPTGPHLTLHQRNSRALSRGEADQSSLSARQFQRHARIAVLRIFERGPDLPPALNFRQDVRKGFRITNP